ncbi:MAG: PhoU domain-containing protein, partial [Pollutimonas bauzanensis]
MSEHTNKQFTSDLETTRSLFLQMGGLVESMVKDGMEALATGDLALVDQVREREKDVNRLEVEIDERISLLIARNQPTAGDLRLLLSVSKMLTDMERCGDEAEKIAKALLDDKGVKYEEIDAGMDAVKRAEMRERSKG